MPALRTACDAQVVQVVVDVSALVHDLEDVQQRGVCERAREQLSGRCGGRKIGLKLTDARLADSACRCGGCDSRVMHGAEIVNVQQDAAAEADDLDEVEVLPADALACRLGESTRNV